MSVREGLEFETVLESDTAPLTVAHRCGPGSLPRRSRCMRDPTRGGLSSALNELAAASKVGVVLDEAAIPLRPEVRGACEMLGLDPLYVANEGKLMAVVPPRDADGVLAAMRALPLGQRRRDRRAGRGRSSRHGHPAVARRRATGRHPADRRTTAEDLLNQSRLREESS